MQTPAQEFNDIAAEAYKAFPAKLGNLVVLLTSLPDKPVYVAPEIAKELTKNTQAVKETVTGIKHLMRQYNAEGMAQRDFNLAGLLVDVIVMNKNMPGTFYRRHTKKMHDFFYLDHEIGHLILKNGLCANHVSRQMAESAADAYAMLRHIQRFGKNTDLACLEIMKTSGDLILVADMDHYTADTLERAAKLANEMDISQLSLRETAKLAEKIAGECCLKKTRLRDISNAFQPVRDAAKKCGSDLQDAATAAHLCREIINVMRSHAGDADIFKAGKRLLMHASFKELIPDDIADASKQAVPHRPQRGMTC